jgi:hypothetical protein
MPPDIVGNREEESIDRIQRILSGSRLTKRDRYHG